MEEPSAEFTLYLISVGTWPPLVALVLEPPKAKQLVGRDTTILTSRPAVLGPLSPQLPWGPVLSPRGPGSWCHPPVNSTSHLDPGIITSHLTEHCPPEDNTRSQRPRPHSQRPWDPAAPISGPTLVLRSYHPNQGVGTSFGTTVASDQPCQDSAHPPAGCSQPQDLLSPNPTHRASTCQSWDTQLRS